MSLFRGTWRHAQCISSWVRSGRADSDRLRLLFSDGYHVPVGREIASRFEASSKNARDLRCTPAKAVREIDRDPALVMGASVIKLEVMLD